MRRRLAVFFAICAVALAACGVGTDSSPHVIPANQVPFDLLATSTTVTATTLPLATESATIYLIGPQRLVPVSRSLPAPLTLGSALSSLVQGPTASEQTQGLRGAINPQTSVISAQITGCLLYTSDFFPGAIKREKDMLWIVTFLTVVLTLVGAYVILRPFFVG